MFEQSSSNIQLPSMPITLTRIIQITRNPDACPQDLADAVMTDQSLTSRVLRLANSAYFRRRSEIETVNDAIITLGFEYVRNLAASASVIESLFPRTHFPGFDWASMWTHSVTTAIAAETISNFISGRTRKGDESAFVAGLLHDIGKLVVACVLPLRFEAVIEECRKTRKEMVLVEPTFLATNHAYIGKQLSESWGFPDKLVQAICWHHAPECALEYVDLARAVSAGNMLAKRLEKPYISGLSADIRLADIAQVAEVEPEDMDWIVNGVRTGLKRSGEILSWGKGLPL